MATLKRPATTLAAFGFLSQQLSYTGRHIVRLCRLQPEYVVMSRASAVSRSEPLTEVRANVANRFGVFTGVACHRTEITVHKGT
jgi:hypothetical protein